MLGDVTDGRVNSDGNLTYCWERSELDKVRSVISLDLKRYFRFYVEIEGRLWRFRKGHRSHSVSNGRGTLSD